MGEPQRAEDGRFVGRFDRLTFYDNARGGRADRRSRLAGARERARLERRRGQSEEYKDIPLSWEIRRQLAGEDGVLIPWRQLLREVFDKGRRNERIDNARRMAARADFMTGGRKRLCWATRRGEALSVRGVRLLIQIKVADTFPIVQVDSRTELVIAVDIARRLDISPQRVHVLVSGPGFPRPLGKLGRSSVWRWSSIERWAQETGRLPRGRRV